MEEPQQAQVQRGPIKKCNKEEFPNVREEKSGTLLFTYFIV